MKTMILRLAIVLLLITSNHPWVPYTWAETWTTLQGQQFEAEFRGMWGNAAIFQRADGRRAAITLPNLEATSRLRVQELAPEVDQKRKQRVEDLKQEAIAAQSRLDPAAGMFGAPKEKRPLPPVVAYAPIPEGVGLEQTLQHQLQQTASGHLRTIWDGLPESYRADLENLRVELTQQIPAEQWNARLETLGKAARLIKDKQDFIFGSSLAAPVLQSMDENAKTELRSSLSSLADHLLAIVDDKRFSHENLKQQELSKLVADLSDENAQSLRQVLESSPGNTVTLWEDLEVSSQGDDRGTVLDKNTQKKEDWVLHEGRWLPEKAVQGWTENIAKLKANLVMILGPESNDRVKQINRTLDDLLSAQDQQAFDGVVLSMMTQFGAGMMPNLNAN